MIAIGRKIRTMIVSLLASSVLVILLPFYSHGMEAGSGKFKFEFSDGKATRPITVWTHRPKKMTSNAPVFFVMHGAKRNGERYRDEWRAHAERDNALLLVPEFSATFFAGGSNYSSAKLRDPSDEGEFTPAAYSAIEKIFDWAVKLAGVQAPDYRLYGHSAGAQFVHRFVMFNPTARVKVAVAANAGWYMMPDFDVGFPYGLKDSGLTDESLKRALVKKLVILLGEKDTDPNHPQLRRTAQAKRQGANRFERGQTFFCAAERQAEKLNAPFNWQLRTVPNVAHSNAGMAGAAAPLLLR